MYAVFDKQYRGNHGNNWLVHRLGKGCTNNMMSLCLYENDQGDLPLWSDTCSDKKDTRREMVSIVITVTAKPIILV